MVKKISEKKEEVFCAGSSCCCNPPLWAVLMVLIGVVWLVEHYTWVDVPLVAILLLVVGLFYCFRRKKK
jgi:hypothetical protein